MIVSAGVLKTDAEKIHLPGLHREYPGGGPGIQNHQRASVPVCQSDGYAAALDPGIQPEAVAPGLPEADHAMDPPGAFGEGGFAAAAACAHISDEGFCPLYADGQKAGKIQAGKYDYNKQSNKHGSLLCVR